KLGDLVCVFSTIKPGLFPHPRIPVTEVKELIKPHFKRRRKEDVLKELPPIVTQEEWIELSHAQRKKYDLTEKQGVADLKGIGDNVTVQHIFALISKLKQICNYDPETQESSKLEYLKEKLS